MRETGAICEAQNRCIFLENTDRLQDLCLQALTDKQKDLEKKHQECLSSMVTMFPKVGLLPVAFSRVSTASRDGARK